MKKLEKELKAVEAILMLLNKCLVLYHQNGYKKEFERTLLDIKKVKRELARVNAAKMAAEVEAKKEPLNNHERKDKRSSTHL